jgi:hypothetical protein
MPGGWSAVSALATGMSTAIILITAIYAARQVREAKAARHIDSLLRIHAQFSSPELSLVRRQLQEGMFGDLTQPLDPKVKKDLDDLLNQMQLLGVLVHLGFLDFDIVRELFPNIPVTWRTARPYIELRQEQQPQYGRRIESLVARYGS